jgi:hypothetical protein
MQGPGPTNVAYDPAPFPPIARLIVVAFIIALGASAVVFSRQFSLNWQIFLLTSLGTVVFPTTALYFFPLLGLWLTAKRRTAGSLVMLVLSLVPFGHWGYSHWSAFQAHRQETAQIASVPTQAAPRVPVTLVVESSSVTGVRAAFTVPQIDHAISKGPFGRELAQFERPQFPSRDSKKLQVTVLPEEYLLLRVGRSSGFATPKQPYAADGGPLELRCIDSSHDDLIAVWYRSFNPAPSTLPVITTFGWFRGDNSATTDEIEDRVAKFLRTALDREAGRRS